MPALDFPRTRERLQRFDLQAFFIEDLGWDRCATRIDVAVDGQPYLLTAVAQKRGLVALVCNTGERPLPDYATRRKIERQVTPLAHEHIVVYTDADRATQVWQWVKREAGRPTACRETTFHRGQFGDPLIQRLQALVFTLEEEEILTIIDVTRRVRAAFDVERVTKRFYDRFQREHAAFLNLIQGIPDEEKRRWYASVMLNRLMFVYFIQKKGFLDDNPDYLRHKLAQSRSRGADRFYGEFLGALFFEGFSRPAGERGGAASQLLGQVPYLDGSLFLRHPIEEQYGTRIRIADAAFERLFTFFEQYTWHLDERPLRADNEINPDVLGYIFEKYINQKQMGAYYTREDITGYISQSTVVPFLLDAARADCRIAFEGEASIWALLAADPDRYIYPAVRKGVELPLPPEIAAGLDDVAQRGEWNRPAPPEYALPTETWREVVARRRRYEEVRGKLAAGQVRSVADLITYNLDIRQFAQDVVELCEGPELLRAIWKALQEVTVLDPTCGSGAFLFAALNILEPLYEACLERMQVFLDELERSGERHRPEKYGDFRRALARMAEHPNPRYFILKSIIVNNLYGVDIMEEAVEICKLRLFLKLVAQVDRVAQVEPLPDIDFNIRTGNTLVGFVTLSDVRRAMTTASNGQMRMVTPEEEVALRRIEEKAQDVERLFALFRRQQTELGGRVTAEDKQALRGRLQDLDDELNRHLAGVYGVEPGKRAAYDRWLTSHKPFHWFVEFYGIMSRGGFDVIIGNPPWIEYSAVKKEYTIRDYTTEKCGNLYGICSERGLSLRFPNGQLSFIVQLPLASSSRMDSARDLLKQNSGSLFVAPFADRPGKLFEGLEHSRGVIFVSSAGRDASTLATTHYQRWPSETRDTLFARLGYTRVLEEPVVSGTFPKYGHPAEEAIFCRVKAKGKQRVAAFLGRSPGRHFVFYQESTEYWIKATTGLPYYAKNGVVGAPPHGRYLYTDREQTVQALCALLNSSLFFVYYTAYSDCFHLSDGLVSGFPVPLDLLRDTELADLNRRLMSDLRKNAERKRISTKAGDEISYDEFYGWKSKPIIDEIDRVLARHYGFTDEELDFIINYDIKYRMGRDEGTEDD